MLYNFSSFIAANVTNSTNVPGTNLNTTALNNSPSPSLTDYQPLSTPQILLCLIAAVWLSCCCSLVYLAYLKQSRENAPSLAETANQPDAETPTQAATNENRLVAH